MHQAEYERPLAQREDAERGEQHAAANLRDAQQAVASAPKAGPRPRLDNWRLAAFIVVFSIAVAPTLHDSVFHTLPDDLLAWLFSSICSAFVLGMLSWGRLGGRQTKLTWIGPAAGVALAVGLLAVRLSSAERTGEVMFAIGLTIVEIAAVLLLEFLARDLRAKEADWDVTHAAESEAP
jgi:peptidoglycan/LPS O-acetylase OafA/YrhL